MREKKVLSRTRILGHIQIANVRLLELAVYRNGVPATFDHRDATGDVNGATPKHLKLF